MRRDNLAFGFAVLLLASCGDDGLEEDWACTAERDTWQKCEDGEVLFCHAYGTPHFHSAAKCALAGLTCTELSDTRAVCTDETTTCTAGEYRCDDNSAINCVDGVAAIRPCGTLEVCLADDQVGLATCYDDRPGAPCGGHGDEFASGCVCDEGYSLEPGSDPERCVASP